MDKTKTSTRRRPRGIKPGMGVELYDPTEALLNEERIDRAIGECLKNGDSEGIIEVIQIHLEAYNQTQMAKEAYISKK